jgi:short-subunit dehydrogenase
MDSLSVKITNISQRYQMLMRKSEKGQRQSSKLSNALTNAVLPVMLEQRHGAIISVASVAGHVALNPLYSGTKFGVRGFSLSLRRQLAHSGISVSLVSPGYINTGMNRGSRLPMPGPDLVARIIVKLVVNPRREVIVPGYYRPLAAIANTFPWLVDLAMSRR